MTKAKQKNWCRRWDSNPRPRDYETLALPLSYTGKSPALPPSYGLPGGRVKQGPPPRREGPALLPIVRIARRKSQARTVARPPRRRGELHPQEPSPPSPSYGLPGGRAKRGPPPRKEECSDSLRFTVLTGRAWSSSSSSSSTSVRLTPAERNPTLRVEHLQPPGPGGG